MAARQWTQEQRAAQAQKIRQHKIWLKSTGPISEQGKKTVSQNALKKGRYTAAKVAERKIITEAKKPLFKGGIVFNDYGDKRYKYSRSGKYKGSGGKTMNLFRLLMGLD